MIAILLIEQNIESLKKMIQEKDIFAKATFHTILGKVTMAIELDALSLNDAEKFIEILFELNEQIDT